MVDEDSGQPVAGGQETIATSDLANADASLPPAGEPTIPAQEAVAPEVVAPEPMEQASAGQATRSADSPVDGQVIETPPTEAQTAQMGRSEPIGSESAPVDGPLAENSEPLSNPVSETQTATVNTEPVTQSPPATSGPIAPAGRDVLVKARAMIQNKKQKKLEKIMELLDKKAQNGSTGSPRVTNDEVEKLLHVSDATATRYLSALEKEGKIKQVGKTGKAVSYVKLVL